MLYIEAIKDIKDAIIEEISGLCKGYDGDVSVIPPDDESNGDLTTNIAFVIAKTVRKKPIDIASAIALRLSNLSTVKSASAVGAGFVNITLAKEIWSDVVIEVLKDRCEYGKSDIGGGAKINIEYVSANPTGPLHAGHGRGAVIGDSLANLLEFAGFDVTREYYVNDAGNQVEILARTVYLHYKALLENHDAEIPDGMYPGDYLKDVAKEIIASCDKKWVNSPQEEWLSEFQKMSVEILLLKIKEDLRELGINHDLFSYESRLHQKKPDIQMSTVEEAAENLKSKGLVYEGALPKPKGIEDENWSEEKLLLFRSSNFGDEQDRALQRPDGSWTYFAGDIAYHMDKFRRGFKNIIDIWGADHESHVRKTKAGVCAVTDGAANMAVLICQMVAFMDNGAPVKMSKRAGTFVTLREVTDAVGKDVFRFFMLTKKSDTHMEFDFQKVKEQSKDNPVFYVQYAHARCRSVLRSFEKMFGKNVFKEEAHTINPNKIEFRSLSDYHISVAKILADWPRQIEQTAKTYELNKIANYLYKLSSAFHRLWQQGRSEPAMRFLNQSDERLSFANAGFVYAVASVIASGLRIFGVEPAEEIV
ncbi:arginine--tRNA ligase [Candidatus Hydrogenosomobacter endosymbioticus]|uniref:Arginine--tRNA ligase n=1 Tax=Candidatus Hydrogenosomobacter endosymbioticus TaxID=2558174 RepID=A0ABN6L6P2_9PROT|nr:arginine--tRNA ligase [Candidatus Hydrogenosomobacter endosymbioticus]BDB96166.1 arginine--tRNA ligase [Candidatus Hydrogenosomobacter endosymbioticus]